MNLSLGSFVTRNCNTRRLIFEEPLIRQDRFEPDLVWVIPHPASLIVDNSAIHVKSYHDQLIPVKRHLDEFVVTRLWGCGIFEFLQSISALTIELLGDFDGVVHHDCQ